MDQEMLEQDLDEYAGEDPLADPDGEPVPPLDSDAANRMLRRLRRLNEDQQRIDDIADREIARIRAWQEDRSAGVDKARQSLLRSLEGFARQTLLRQGTRTINLPNGKLMLRKPSKRTIVENLDEFVEWATSAGMDEFIRRAQPAPNLAALAKLENSTFQPTGEKEQASVVSPDGEVIPGVVAQRDVADTFSVKVA